MHSRTIDVVTEWETVATPAGYEGLRKLADAEFSGAVSAGTTWAFFLNGRVVGVFEGDMEDFAEADVTAYRAADPSLPLLFAMQERGGETRANYYTNETPLRDVDQTLSNGGFTGYVELSENVLSGDYYVVYHGGKSMSAAFVGSSERLLTGEEAFETADDEVGIYEVVNVGIELVDIPEPVDDAVDENEADADGPSADTGAVGAATPAPLEEPDASAATPADDPEASETKGDEPEVSDTAGDGESPDAAAEADPRDGGVEAGVAENVTGSDGEPEPAAGEDAPQTESTDPEDSPQDTTARAESSAEPADDLGGASREPAPDTDPDAEPEGTAETPATAGSDTGSDAPGAGGPAVGGGSTTPTEMPSRASSDDVARERASETETADAAGPSTGTDTIDAAASEPIPTESESQTESDAGADRTAPTSTADPGGEPNATAEPGLSAASEASDGALGDEKRWQDARTIPSLDPEKSTGTPTPDEETEQSARRERTARMQRQRERRRSRRDDADAAHASSTAERRGDAGETVAAAETDDGVERLRRRLSRARERVESLEAERDELLEARTELQDEREELIEERAELRSERAEHTDRIEELEAECERLRSEVDRLESELEADSAETASTESISPERALSGTNLFVRYDTKGQATLKHAHAGDAARDDVRENLRLEHHTTFEAEGVVVDDEPYETFLHDSTEYAFAHWVIAELLYEIGETGNRSGLAGVFDAIPDIDRVELHGEVGVETDDGVEQRAFDVIYRDRMGDPLFVADINPSRNATTEAMVGSLVENTGTVATEEKSLAAGFYVTESFYEPGALETVAERTSGGILSRSSKRSFVKLSRKRGYHLCLVEARDGEFHLNVPEL